MAWLNEAHRTIFENPIVEFVSANLINEGNNNRISFVAL